MQLKSMYKVLATTFILGQTMVGPVLTHADTVPTNAGTHAKQQSNMDTTLGNLPFINLAIDGEDFGEKPKEDGKKYVEDRMKEQEKKMSVSEVRALKDFITKDENTINDYLFKNDGKLMDKDPLNTKIEKLDDILKAQRIDTSIKVYQTIPSMKIGSAQNLREKILTNSIYEITSLSKASGSDPLLEITVPKGSHAAYGMNGDSASLILERGSGLLVTDVKQITDKGITRIKIEAKILSSEEIRNREKDLSPQLKSANEMLTQKMGLPVTLHSYNPDLSNTVNASYNAITDFKKGFDNLFKSGVVPKATAGETIFHQLEKNGLKITLQEGLSISAEGVSESAILAGGYSPDLKEIRLDTMNPDLAGTLSHELGHAIDDLYFNYQLGKDPELVTLFSKDKKAFVKAFGFDIDKDYSNASAEQKVHEYFAESFAQFVLNNPKLKTAVPDTYEKIKQILQKESV